ncbi:MAG: ketopantoate reductase family protein [Gemmatimonadaceae bacterium]
MTSTGIPNATRPSLRIVVLGAGGVGGWYGGSLALAGHDVTLLARDAHLGAIREHGLELRSPDGSVRHAPVRATDDPAQLGEPSLVIVTVKTYSLTEIAPVAARLGSAGAVVLPLLNGVDAADRLAAAGVPRSALLAGVTIISAARVAPGVIERRSEFQRVVVGVPAGFAGPSARESEAIVQAFRDAGVEASVSPHVEVDLWNKLAFLASMAAACGLARAAVGAVRSAPLGTLLIERAVAEVVAVADARGISLGADATARTIAAINSLPPAMRPSLLLDLEHAGPTEVDVLSGAIARMGREAGVPTPVHDTAWTAISAATVRNRL